MGQRIVFTKVHWPKCGTAVAQLFPNKSVCARLRTASSHINH
jgi:hypothetical protein